jgi:hypothetical protein
MSALRLHDRGGPGYTPVHVRFGPKAPVRPISCCVTWLIVRRPHPRQAAIGKSEDFLRVRYAAQVVKSEKQSGKADEINIDRPRVLQSPANREASLAAAPITVNWRRSGTPMLPYITSPTWSARPNSRVGSPRCRRVWFSASTRPLSSMQPASSAEPYRRGKAKEPGFATGLFVFRI